MWKSKLREGLMLMFNNEPGTFLTEGSGGAVRKSANFLKRVVLITLFCALGFMLSAPSLVQAEDLQQGTPAEQPSANVQPASAAAPAGHKTSAVTENKVPAKANTRAGDGLEISPEIIGQGVGEGNIEAPTINNVFYKATTISGKKLHRDRVDGKIVRATVHVTLKDKNGKVKATVSVTPKSGSTWSVKLPAGVEVAEGDTVTAYQELNDVKSPEVTADAEPSKADQITLTMPVGEIWIEQTVANIVNDEEKAEAAAMLKAVNPGIFNDKTKIDFSIGGVGDKTAYYEITYDDGSKTGKLSAPDLKIKQVTETSRGVSISDITVVDNVIKGKLEGDGPFGDIKVQIILKVRTPGFGDEDSSNPEIKKQKCTTDKNSSDPVDAIVNSETGEFTYTLGGSDSLTADQVVGVSVKEKNKFKSCGTSSVKLPTPKKTDVRDSRKLTKDDKTAIIKAIKEAYTVNGKSKLPNGTGDWDGVPAVIQFDDSGNVKIFRGNDVAGTWDPNNNYKFVPEKNEDGSYKINDGAKPTTTIPAKDLVKNIAPKSPGIEVDTDKGEVTITPPAYTEPGEDTDLASYTFTYNDASGAEKTVTATRTVDEASGKTTWTADNAKVDANTGVITLSVEDIEVGGTITATAKDNGGLEGDTDKLDSTEKTQTLETATVSYDRNGGTGEMTGKTVNKGSKYKILANTFTAPANEKFKTWKIGQTEYSAGDEITVKEDTTIKAIWQDIEVKVSYNPNGGSGDMEGKTLKKGSKYTLLESSFKAPDENHEFKAWEVDGQEVPAGTEITVDKDTEVKAVWKKIQVKVTYDANGGSGTMDGKTVDKGSNYMVLANAFTAPDDTQEFDTWEVNGEKVKPGTEIKADKDTVIKAIWKKIQVNVTYDANGGSGEMTGATVDKGSNYTVLPNGFKAPDDTQEFDTWEVNGEKVAPGSKIKADKDTVIKALWKKIQVNVTYDANGGEGTMEGKTLDKGGTYKLLASTFTAPKNKEFKAWEIDGKEEAPDTEITVNKDTTVKAIWKDIKVDINFDPGEGSGTMDKATVKKGSKFKLPDSKFEAPKNKEFKGWKIGEKEYQVGDEITVNGNTTITALWKDKPVPPSTTPGKDKPGNQAKPQPKPQNQNPAAAGNLSKTGANGMYSLYASLLLLATGGLFLISLRRRNQR